MPDDAILEGALRTVARRLRLDRTLRLLSDAAAMVAAIVLIAVAASRVLPSAASTALSILLGLCAIAVLCTLVSRFVVGPRTTLAYAAGVADRRAGLADLLVSGHAFAAQATRSAWTEIALARAQAAARALDVARVAPLRLPRSGVVAVALAALCGGVASLPAPTDAPAAGVASDPTRRPAPAAAIVDTLREMAAEAARRGDRTAQARLERTIATLSDPDAGPDAQRRALEDVKSMVGQRNLEAAAQMEGLQSLADALAQREGFDGVAAALKAGDARAAADALRAMQQGAGGARGAADPAGTDAGSTRPLLDDLKAALQDAAHPPGPDDGPQGETVGKLQKAIDKLDELAKRLEAAGTYNQGQRKLAQQTMALDSDAPQRANRAGEAQGGPNAGNSPETGNADIAGGTMYRNPDDAPVADAGRQARGDGGRGDATGESPGDPVVGDEATKLDARFQRQRVEGMSSEGRDGPDTAFYAASRAADAKVAVRAGAIAARGATEDALGRERIALRHRAQVKQYFTPGSEAK